jgi:predicted nucleotidyltransferase
VYVIKDTCTIIKTGVIETRQNGITMRFHETLDDILGSKSKIRILRLLHRTKGSYTGREIAKLIDHSPDATNKALKGLASQGLLNLQYVGTSHLYSLNEDHIFVDRVLDKAFNLEQNALLEVAKIFYEKIGSDLESIIFFGSIIKGKERPDSDIDMVISIKDAANISEIEDACFEAPTKTSNMFGNPILPFYIFANDLKKKKNSRVKKGMWKDIFDKGDAIIYTNEEISSYVSRNKNS